MQTCPTNSKCLQCKLAQLIVNVCKSHRNVVHITQLNFQRTATQGGGHHPLSKWEEIGDRRQVVRWRVMVPHTHTYMWHSPSLTCHPPPTDRRPQLMCHPFSQMTSVRVSVGRAWLWLLLGSCPEGRGGTQNGRTSHTKLQGGGSGALYIDNHNNDDQGSACNSEMRIKH